jgi:hypothetical protein
MSGISENVKIRYIKLGIGGEWEKDCIENDNCIRLAYENNFHKECLMGEWRNVEKFSEEWSDDKGARTRHINQIKQFYEMGENDIWITFYNGKLYWCQASKKVIELKDKSRVRKVVSNNGKWSDKDILGNKKFNIGNLDGRVIQVQKFQGTICEPQLSKYLINKINGIESQIIQRIGKNLEGLRGDILELIKGLNENDFELFVELILTSIGLKRMSIVGKAEKDIDIDLFNPINDHRIFVQIKSQADKKTFNDYIDIFNNYNIYDEMYFVVHTSNDDLKCLERENITLIDESKLPNLVIKSGMISWLVKKRS